MCFNCFPFYIFYGHICNNWWIQNISEHGSETGSYSFVWFCWHEITEEMTLGKTISWVCNYKQLPKKWLWDELMICLRMSPTPWKWLILDSQSFLNSFELQWITRKSKYFGVMYILFQTLLTEQSWARYSNSLNLYFFINKMERISI